jgi:hypothetical protein
METRSPRRGLGARRRRFLALMVGAPGSLALTPPRGPLSMFLSVDGGCSWISINTRQGARHQCFLALMLGALGSTAPTTPGGSPSKIFILMVDTLGSPSAHASGSVIDIS